MKYLLLLLSFTVNASVNNMNFEFGQANGTFLPDHHGTTQFNFQTTTPGTISGNWQMNSFGGFRNGRQIVLNNFGLFDALNTKQDALFTQFVASPSSIGSLVTANLNPGVYSIRIDADSWGRVDSSAQLTQNPVPIPAGVWLFVSGIGFLWKLREA